MIKRFILILTLAAAIATAPRQSSGQIPIIILTGTNFVDYRVLNTNFALLADAITNIPGATDTWSVVSGAVTAAAMSWPAVSAAVTEASSSWPAVSGAVTAAAGSWPAVSAAVTEASSSWPAVSAAVTEASSSWPAVSGAVTAAANSWPAVSGAVTAAAGSWPVVSGAVTEAAQSWPAVSGVVSALAYDALPKSVTNNLEIKALKIAGKTPLNHATWGSTNETGDGAWIPLIGFCAFPSAQTTMISGSNTVITFGTENFDDGNCYNPTNNTFTAPCDGRYLITAKVYFLSPVAGQAGGIKVSWTGQTDTEGYIFSSTRSITLSITSIRNLTKGDTAQIVVSHDCGANKQSEASGTHSSFSGHKIK